MVINMKEYIRINNIYYIHQEESAKRAYHRKKAGPAMPGTRPIYKI
jgi:hypothetical protein